MLKEPEPRFFPRVGDIAHKGVFQLTGDSTVEISVAMMNSNNLGDIIFSHEGGYSIFTIDDLLTFRRQKRNLSTPLRDVVSSPLCSVDEDENVLNLLQKFDDSNSRYLGVLDKHGVLAGVVSYTDVLDSVDPSVMMERKRLSDILNNRSVELVEADMPTEDVLLRLRRAEDAVLVTEQGKLAGILTSKDIVRIINERYDTSLPVRRHMISPVDTIGKNETIKDAIAYLQKKKFKRVVVVDEESGRIIGIISQKDLINSTYGRWADLMKLHAKELDELIRVLEAKNRKLTEESLTDPLTGIGNRRKINQSIEAEVGRYYRHGNLSFSLLMLDIDHFKQINDRHGHIIGDTVLQHLCKVVNEMLRVSDMMGRWGGEEFIILLPETPISSSATLAERISKRIAESPVDGISLTVSIGATEYRKGESIEELIDRVDQALYEAKNEGRNRVVTTG